MTYVLSLARIISFIPATALRDRYCYHPLSQTRKLRLKRDEATCRRPQSWQVVELSLPDSQDLGLIALQKSENQMLLVCIYDSCELWAPAQRLWAPDDKWPVSGKSCPGRASLSTGQSEVTWPALKQTLWWPLWFFSQRQGEMDSSAKVAIYFLII